MVLFELLAGRLPVRNEDLGQLLVRKFRDPNSIFTATPSASSALIDDELERIILRALAPKPRDRYSDCYEFREDLLAYRDAHVPRAPKERRV